METKRSEGGKPKAMKEAAEVVRKAPRQDPRNGAVKTNGLDLGLV